MTSLSSYDDVEDLQEENSGDPEGKVIFWLLLYDEANKCLNYEITWLKCSPVWKVWAFIAFTVEMYQPILSFLVKLCGDCDIFHVILSLSALRFVAL